MVIDKQKIFSISQKKELVIFGAGYIADKTMNFGEDKFSFVLDNDDRKWNTVFRGKDVKNPEILNDLNKDEFFIVICCEDYNGVKEQLEKLGFIESKHFGISVLLKNHFAFDTINKSSEQLLVTVTGKNGGLYLLNTRSGSYNIVHKGSMRGITVVDDFIWIVTDREGLWKLDFNLNILVKFENIDFYQPCGLTFDVKSNSFFVANTGTDEIFVIDANNGVVTKKIPLSDRYSITGKEQHHINDLIIINNSLFVSMFSKSGFWRNDIYDGGIKIYDLTKDMFCSDFYTELIKPHSIECFEDKIYYCDSFNGIVYRGTSEIIGKFHGFLRGIEKNGDLLYVGQSRNRHTDESFRLDHPTNINTGIIIYLIKDKIYRFVNINDVTDIYGIIDLGKYIANEPERE